MPNLVALSLMVSDKKIFKRFIFFFKFSCHGNQSFLASLDIGQRAYFMVRCPSCVCPCVTFFFKHLLIRNYLSDYHEISQKYSCHGPLQNLLKKFDSVKNSGCHGNKTFFFLNHLKSSCQKPQGLELPNLACSFM